MVNPDFLAQIKEQFKMGKLIINVFEGYQNEWRTF
jgi:hypothetical protein